VLAQIWSFAAEDLLQSRADQFGLGADSSLALTKRPLAARLHLQIAGDRLAGEALLVSRISHPRAPAIC
jgi:hypothetical protein